MNQVAEINQSISRVELGPVAARGDTWCLGLPSPRQFNFSAIEMDVQLQKAPVNSCADGGRIRLRTQIRRNS